ncbi:MAG: hypothetical protein JNJ45_08940 [Chthonomonas sp.]|nr:hypothetical protein [Chthonomonas sp.]
MEMRFLLISKDPEVVKAAQDAFERIGKLEVFENWEEGLNASEGTDLMFVDILATLKDAHKIAGYEAFAHAKMAHDVARHVKLILIAEPPGYDLDFMAGWPDFLFARLPRPISPKILLRMSTYV